MATKAAALGVVKARTVDSDDVTDQVVDLKGRLENAEASAKRLRELLAQAEVLDNVVTLEERLAQHRAPPVSFADRVAIEIEARLTQGEVAQGDVASALAVSPRTLQRRLDADGLTFSGVLDGVRKRRAQELLTDGALSVQEVAYLLGYSEPRAFHRSFRRWTGSSAGAWRRGAR